MQFKFLAFQIIFFASVNCKLNVLHISFHKGCINEIENLSKYLPINLESIFIPDLEKYLFDYQSYGNKLYNIGHERAQRIWEKHKNFFEKFNVIITSDTVALSRIFLQNKFKNYLIIWICNRFDYYDAQSLDCNFPDQEFYDLLKKAKYNDKVFIVSYAKFEKYYASFKGFDSGNLVINPAGFDYKSNGGSIPKNINKSEYFFIPPYHNNFVFMNLSAKCSSLGIKNYCGRYNGSSDIKDFKGIINLPGAWTNFAFFENIQHGIPYFVPSINFLCKLQQLGNYFIPDSYHFFQLKKYDLCDWYSPEFQEIITYFDSWEDLQQKSMNIDFQKLKNSIISFAKIHKEKNICAWKDIFAKIHN